MLTTITPYWGRPELLRAWVQAVGNSNCLGVSHIILVVDEPLPKLPRLHCSIRMIGCQGSRGGPKVSIGHWHNVGAKLANTEWIMKLDADAFPHQTYFSALLRVLSAAPERAWYNSGMFYVNRDSSGIYLNGVVPTPVYLNIIDNLSSHSASAYPWPQASNFICRRADYLRLGGCHSGFKGWGWEDYQQLYMLQRHALQTNTLLEGHVMLDNVTDKCRDQIARPAARDLFLHDRQLALLHRWHPCSGDLSYRSNQLSDKNRKVLFDYINSPNPPISL